MEEKNRKEKSNESSLMHDINTKSRSPFLSMKLVVFLLIFAFLGLGTGYFLSGANSSSSNIAKKVGSLGGGGIEKGEKYGDGDPKVFKDTAEGVVREGGIEGEGQYHLERPGGESQNVYMTSSVVDLSQFEGKKVKVWGKTFDAQKAGWLMDVGIVEVL